jgi:hypothetical protein
MYGSNTAHCLRGKIFIPYSMASYLCSYNCGRLVSVFSLQKNVIKRRSLLASSATCATQPCCGHSCRTSRSSEYLLNTSYDFYVLLTVLHLYVLLTVLHLYVLLTVLHLYVLLTVLHLYVLLTVLHLYVLLTVLYLYVLLTVLQLTIILVNGQLDAQFFFYMFISILYMFRATSCSSSGESIVLIQGLVCR